jgi:hypothetical protein
MEGLYMTTKGISYVISKALLAVLVLAGGGMVQAFGGPFGFERGMTRAQIIALVGQDSVNVKQSEANILVLTSAPKPQPAFESYILFISPTEGLLKVVANGKTITTGDSGAELRDDFDSIVGGVTQKYGTNTKAFDSCNAGVGCSGEGNWMLALLEKNRALSTYWTRSENQASPITVISVGAVAMSPNKGYVILFCEFKGWEAYVDARKTKQNDSL